MHTRRDEITTLLRRRILSGVRARALRPGARLPSTRELAHQLGSDPRVVLAAYRELAAERLVELRPRSGIYLAEGALGAAEAAPPQRWLVELLLDGIEHEIPASALGEWLTRAARPLSVRALVVACTVDQLDGIAEELRADFGVEVVPLEGEPLVERPEELAAHAAGAQLVVADPTAARALRPVIERLALPLVLASVGPDLLGDEWRRLLEQAIYIVYVDPRFERVARDRFAAAPQGMARLTLVQLGRDDPGNIPADAAVYVTRAARARLAGARVPGRLIAPARALDAAAARALLELIVRVNLSSPDPVSRDS